MGGKVGIVVPSYNQGKYLERTIKSIIANMKNTDILLVVIDGGSSDDSVDIIKKYDNYIYYWHSKKDNGQAAAVNEGMRHLNDCKYVMWLNSDDEYENEYSVKKIVEYAELTGYKICYGKSNFIDKAGERIGIYPTIPFNKELLQKGCFLSQPSVLILKSVWDEYGGLDERLQMCLDYEMWIRLSHKYTFGYIEEFIGNTRMYGDTKTSKMQSIHLNEAICILVKQYGKVCINWIYEKWRCEHKGEWICRLPCKSVKLFLLLRKMKYIKHAQKSCNYN